VYSDAHVAEMESNCRRLAAEVQALMLDGLAQCNSLASPKAKQHMFQGVGLIAA